MRIKKGEPVVFHDNGKYYKGVVVKRDGNRWLIKSGPYQPFSVHKMQVVHEQDFDPEFKNTPKEYKAMNKKQRQFIAGELVKVAKDLVANKWEIEYFPSTSNRRKIVKVRNDRDAIHHIKNNNLDEDAEDLTIYDDKGDEYYYENGKLIKASRKLVADRDKSKKLTMLKLLNKAMSSMPGSPEQKKLINELNKHRKDFGLKPLTASVVNAKSSVVQIHDLWNDVKYFTRRGLNATERSVVNSVNHLDDVITMGKIIGVPSQFWKPQDKADFRKYGLDTKFKIAKVAKDLVAKNDFEKQIKEIKSLMQEAVRLDNNDEDPQSVIFDAFDLMTDVYKHHVKVGKLIQQAAYEIDQYGQDVKNYNKAMRAIEEVIRNR